MRHMLMNVLVGFPTFLAFGYSLTFFGGVMGYSAFFQMFPELNTATTTGALKDHNSLIQGTCNGASNLGGIVGCLSVMYLGNKLGRRRNTMIGAVLCIVGTVLFSAAYSMAQMVLGRVIQGWGVGMMISTVPVWQSELSSTKQRGGHVILDGIMVSGGFALAAWITYGFGKADTVASWKWRIPGIIMGVFGLMVAGGVYLFPESPRWLVMVGRVDEARAVFSDIRGQAPDSEEVENELAAVMRANDLVAHTKWTGLFSQKNDQMLWRLFIAVSVQFYTQMNGAGIITAYSNNLFGTIGLEPATAKIVAAVSLTFKFAMCFIAYFTIERFGRRNLFMVSGAGMAVCMFCLAICGSQTTPTKLGPAYAAIVFVFLFLIFLPLAYLGVNFLYCQEVISTRYRAPAGGISTAVLWLTQFVLALTTPLGLQVLSWRYYLIWGAVSATIVPFVWMYYPETTGLSMEELEDIWKVGGPRAAVREARRLRDMKTQSGMESTTADGDTYSLETPQNEKMVDEKLVEQT